MRKLFITTLGLGLIGFSAACGGDPAGEPLDDPALAASIEADLEKFDSDPNTFLNTLPKKTATDSTVKLFDATDISNKTYVDAKNSVIRMDPTADAPGANDQARNLVDALVLTKLEDMHLIRKASLPESPWSDDYWGLYAGSTAKRYADPGANITQDWKANTDYVRNMPPANTDNLSPAEKYDLLVGDANKTLTKYNLDTGKGYYNTYGSVETWMGICHGWAPASYMVPRPLKTVTVKAADGVTNIQFYPSDIKALASELWATTNPRTKFIGGRCNTKTPAVDSIGRIKDTACRDTNAGTWHLAIVNQIGKAQRSMVLDATFDYEVWNQPTYAYDYNYFNPKTKKTYKTIASSKVAVADFPEDKFKAYRAAGTTHIVGVTMDVKWTVETEPSHFSPDAPSRDAISGARYLYTLELDASGNIIGGEWMQNAHPDFLWTPPPGTVAKAPFESSATGTWDGTTAVPTSWKSAAAQSSVSGAPLNAIVQALATLSRK